MRLSKYIVISLLLIALNILCSGVNIAQNKSLNNPNKSDNVDIVIAISNNECINCYYGINDIIQSLDTKRTLFIITGVPKREVPYFFEQKLNMNSDSINWLLSDSLFKEYTDKFNNESSIYYYQDTQLLYSGSLRFIDKTIILNLINGESKKYFEEKQVWDITGFGGDGNSVFNMMNTDTALIYNSIRNKLYLYSLSTHSMMRAFELPVTKDNIEEWLRFSELDAEDLLYARNNKAGREYINSMNRITIDAPLVSEKFVYLPINILAYDIQINTESDTSVLLKWYSYLAQYDNNLNFISKYAFPYQFNGLNNHFNYLDNAELMEDDLLYMKPSTRLRDSIIAIYKLKPSNNPELIAFPDIAYPERFPLKVGPYAKVYYSDFITSDIYYFKEEPVVYLLSTKDTIELVGWNYTRIGDSTRTGFWVDNIILIDDTYFVFGISNGMTIVKAYDINFNLQGSQLLASKPYLSIIHSNKTIYGLISDEESIIIKSFILKE